MVSTATIGLVTLYFKNRILILENCLYVLDIQMNLILVTSLHLQGYTVIFNYAVLNSYNKMNVCSVHWLMVYII